MSSFSTAMEQVPVFLVWARTKINLWRTWVYGNIYAVMTQQVNPFGTRRFTTRWIRMLVLVTTTTRILRMDPRSWPRWDCRTFWFSIWSLTIQGLTSQNRPQNLLLTIWIYTISKMVIMIVVEPRYLRCILWATTCTTKSNITTMGMVTRLNRITIKYPPCYTQATWSLGSSRMPCQIFRNANWVPMQITIGKTNRFFPPCSLWATTCGRICSLWTMSMGTVYLTWPIKCPPWSTPATWSTESCPMQGSMFPPLRWVHSIRIQ